MQLNEVLEENSIKSISEKTNISEENLEALFSKDFGYLKRVKTMGFISIVEREYRADLSALRQEASDYYDMYPEEESMMLEAPAMERKRGGFKLKVVLVLLLIGMASWYFLTKFDQEKLRGLLPFQGEAVVEHIKQEVDSDPNLSIEHAIDESNENSEVTTQGIVDKSITSETESIVTGTNGSNE